MTEMRGEQGALRCSDRDRERIAEHVRAAAGEGRLGLDELDARLDAAYTARTYDDLAAVVADLPGAAGVAPTSRLPTARDVLRLSAPVFDRIQRGRWVVPPRIEATAWLGKVRVDFVDAVCAHDVVEVVARAHLASVVLVVPDGWSVRMDEVSAGAGSVKDRVLRSGTTPLLRVRGGAAVGDVIARPPRQSRWLPR